MKVPPTFWRSSLTDNRGEFDTGRIIVPIAVTAMIAISAFDVMANGRQFDPQGLGIGIGGVLTGFAAYLFGDAKNTEATK